MESVAPTEERPFAAQALPGILRTMTLQNKAG